MKSENRAAAGVRFEQIGETRFDARALVAKGERAARRRNVIGETLAVFIGLDFDGSKRDSGFFGFDYANRRAIDVEQVIGEAVTLLEGVFADGNTLGGAKVHLVAGLNRPAGGSQQPIDFGAGFLFRGHQYVGK